MLAGTHAAQRKAGSKRLTTGLLLVLLAICLAGEEAAGQTHAKDEGKVHGRVTEQETGQPLIGVTVALRGTKLGAFTDLEGFFEITGVPSGSYTLVATSVGFDTATVTPILIKAGETTEVSLKLAEVMLEVQGMTVTGKASQNTDASVMKKRRESTAVQDGISAQEIARTGSGDAADAARRVVGASVVDGRYVYVRGLGGRYTNTMLNGTPLPSPDPDKQGAPMDLIPANLLDNIIVSKSFTPDKPGDFAGGSVDLNTRDFPEQRAISFSTSTSYNSNTTGNNDVLTYEGGSKDWMGTDDGTRDYVPDYLMDPQYRTVTPSSAGRDTTLALQLDRDSKAISSGMKPSYRTAPLNQSYAVSLGDTRKLFGRDLGVNASFSYSRNHSSYTDGVRSRWTLNVGSPMDLQGNYTEKYGKDEVLWSGFGHAAYRFAENHKLSAAYTSTRNAESTTKYFEGYYYNTGSDGVFRSWSLQYNERRLTSLQVQGDHKQLLGGPDLSWKIADTRITQDEPDRRLFADEALPIGEGVDTSYNVFGNDLPKHYFRYITERNRSGQVDLAVPFEQWSGLLAKFKAGVSFVHKTRDFRERKFQMNTPRVIDPLYAIKYSGDPDEYFAPENIGMLADTSADRYIDLGISWSAGTDPEGFYSATQDIAGTYAMVEMPIWSRMLLITGLRYETTRMNLDRLFVSDDTTDLVDGHNLLPSVNFVYHPHDKMNVRAAFGRTLARPSFRELSPFPTLEAIGGNFVYGNDSLKYTEIDNYDLRWEWFPRAGELLAVSLFYKKLTNPIEIAMKGQNDSETWENAKEGELVGLELEVKQRLDRLHKLLRNLQVGGNYSLIDAHRTLSEADLAAERILNPGADDQGPFFNQSRYIINAEVSYLRQSSGTAVSLLYNRFGKRLVKVTYSYNPDVWELPESTIDLTLCQRIWRGMTMKAAAKNLTDKETHWVQFNDGKQFDCARYSYGRTFSIGMTYQL
ncbi:MAG: TonB-dependent receptor [Candidatus Zixiibacteriota bacterium]